MCPSSQSCDCEDCVMHFSEHGKYHATFHTGCKFCIQIVKNIPHFSFFIPDEKKRISGSYPEPPKYDLNFDLPPGQKVTEEILRLWSEKLRGDFEDNSLWCTVCPKFFWSNLDRLRQHIIDQHKHLVSKSFRHHYRNNDQKAVAVFECHQCATCFASRHDLQRHIDGKHYKQRFECDICQMKFSREDNYKRHRKNKTKQRYGSFVM